MKVAGGPSTLLNQVKSTDTGPHSGAIGRHGGAKETHPPPSTVVEVGPLGQTLFQAESSLAAQSVVDKVQVAHFAKAISEGTYSVKAEQVAERIFETELGLEHSLG